jgi:hypothetical protein
MHGLDDVLGLNCTSVSRKNTRVVLRASCRLAPRMRTFVTFWCRHFGARSPNQ